MNGPPRRHSGARYCHQQRMRGTTTGPLTRYSFASQERQCRLALWRGWIVTCGRDLRVMAGVSRFAGR